MNDYIVRRRSDVRPASKGHLVRWLVVPMSATMVALIGLFIYLDKHFDRITDETRRRVLEWHEKMRASECRRVGFVGDTALPVWSCPDGQVYREGIDAPPAATMHTPN